MNRFSSLIALLVVFMIAPVAAQDVISRSDAATIVHARALIEQGNARQAYQLLAPLEHRYAGDPRFDYSFGVAALEGGQPSEALFALRRAAVRKPADAGIRVDLARAYYEIGDNEAARLEFEALQGMNPPPQTQQVINQYLKSLSRRSAKYRSRLAATLGLEAGADSNATSATALREFQGFTLTEQSRAADSPYGGLFASGTWSRPFLPRYQFVADGEADWREYPDASYASRLRYGAGLGLTHRRRDWSWLLRLGANATQVDGEANNELGSVDAAVNVALGQAWLITANARYAQRRFTDEISIRDTDELLFACGAARTLSMGRGGKFEWAVLYGQSDAVEAGSPYSRDMLGLTTELILLGRPGVQWLAGLSVLQSDFEGQFLGQARKDLNLNAYAGVNLQTARLPGWIMRPQLRAIDNDSDVAVHDFDRLEAGIQIRRLFE